MSKITKTTKSKGRYVHIVMSQYWPESVWQTMELAYARVGVLLKADPFDVVDVCAMWLPDEGGQNE